MWEGSIPHDDGRKVTHDDNHDRLQNVCTDAALSYGAGILQKTSPCYFLKKTIDMQQHDEVLNDIIENLEYGNMLVAENKC